MLKKILIFIPVLIILIIAVRIFIVYTDQKEELNYHKNIPQSIKLWSDDFEQNGPIPTLHTGLGENASPSLYWDNLPEGTQSLAIIVVDYDAPSPFIKLMTVDHWVIFNINPEIKFLESAQTAEQLKQNNMSLGTNITKGVEYVGPNPPFGTHRYYFRIYALSVPHIELLQPAKKDLMKAMKDHILAFGELTGTYKK